ncbi:MAG: DUF1549 domain-containing protein [Myxococcaceae bacterium]|nr:DUF1549 domain-containing protein [Myxococcaceae bacterium]
MTRVHSLVCAAALVLCAAGCKPEQPFDPENPAVGPGGLVGDGTPITDGNFAGGDDVLPEPRAVAPPDDTRPPDCDGDCDAFCAQAGLKNPVNRGLCQSLWGVGLAPRPIDEEEACRRLFIDMVGHVPTREEMTQTCSGGWGATVKRLLDDPRFVEVNQRRMADEFLYANEVVNFQAIYDMDRLVGKLYRGEIPYDLFATVAAAHPVLTRRVADPRDIVEALYRHFLGRPPFENERADMARLYATWHHGYYDHPYLNMRLPDAFVRFPCVNEDGEPDPQREGECTSVLWGYNPLVFTPDFRAARDPQTNQLVMWSGLLTPDEWERAEIPGKILAKDLAFWEHAVEVVLEQYLGYNLGQQIPEVREELVKFLLANNGDIRSVHFAVATSIAYLQSNAGASSARYRWTYGPLKQMDAEVWLDSLAQHTGLKTASCDHRIPQPEAFLESGSLNAYRVLEHSKWRFNDEGEIDTSYSDVARTLGGCPENVVGGRFKVVSILTTATQLNFVNEVCNPAQDDRLRSAPIAKLLPSGMDARKAVTSDLAGQIAAYQYRALVGHEPTQEELAEAKDAGEQCALTRCSAEEFARPLCFALMSSAQMLFY